MLKITKEKKDLIKDIAKTNTDVYKICEEEIKTAVFKKLNAVILLSILEKELNKKLSLPALRKYITRNKKRWIKEKRQKR